MKAREQFEVASSGTSALEAFFSPRTVAVIGGTDRQGSVGRAVLENLLEKSFKGRVFTVNPKRSQVLGRPAYRSIGEVPEKVDLAIVVTPAPTVPGIIGECVDAGVRAAVVISAGFKEHGPEGARLERKIEEHLRRGTTRVIGPNCLGVMNPILGLNATFSQAIARPGNVAFISQSGALLTAILDWSFREQVGFSGFVSTGSMLDVGWGDLIDHYGDDAHTKSILIYLESVGDARSFVSAAREVALTKPIIVIKAGSSEAGSKAAASHTGALTGSDEVFDAAMRRCGILRVTSIADLFYMAEALGKQPRPKGPRLTVVTNAGGPAVLAADALINTGGQLATLSGKTISALDEFLPPHWSHGNPVDILGDAEADRYRRAVELALGDEGSDGVLIILAPQAMTDPASVAKGIARTAQGKAKPILASWMGARTVSAGETILNAAGIPTFGYPDTAARTFNYMWRLTYNLRGLYETPALADELPHGERSREQAREIIAAAERRGRTLLTEAESKQILSLYGIPTVETRVARSAEEAAQLAQEIGLPVVLKLHSESITHKTDVGGVELNLATREAVVEAYRSIEAAVRRKAGPGHFLGVAVEPMVRTGGCELIIGSSIDPQFGPVILFGSGGQYVQVYKDRALALPPLSTTLAQRMMEQTKVFSALKGLRGQRSVDLAALEKLLVRFSRLVVEQRRIREIDVNPLLASAEGLLALDARIVLEGTEVAEKDLPCPAIRPYPQKYVSPWVMKDGAQVLIRPIRPEDEPLLRKFHETLSERTVYMRYFSMSGLSYRISHERLVRSCFIDYDREMALVAEWKNPATDASAILGVARLKRQHGTNQAEVAILVSDARQKHGLGTELLRRLVAFARDEKIERIFAHALTGNYEMQALGAKLGFYSRQTEDPSIVLYVLDLETRTEPSPADPSA